MDTTYNQDTSVAGLRAVQLAAGSGSRRAIGDGSRRSDGGLQHGVGFSWRMCGGLGIFDVGIVAEKLVDVSGIKLRKLPERQAP